MYIYIYIDIDIYLFKTKSCLAVHNRKKKVKCILTVLCTAAWSKSHLPGSILFPKD